MAKAPAHVPADAALLVVDVQEDFCPGGALAVPRGDAVVPVLNAWVEAFGRAGRPIAYSQDWHPPRHVSFKERGGPWPPHCIQGSKGAQFHPRLRVAGPTFRKGFELDRDAYSAFEAHLADAGGIGPVTLSQWLREKGVRQVFIGGLTLDYCVRQTALDALRAGFRVTVIADATRAVDVNPGDGANALKEIEVAGGGVV